MREGSRVWLEEFVLACCVADQMIEVLLSEELLAATSPTYVTITSLLQAAAKGPNQTVPYNCTVSQATSLLQPGGWVLRGETVSFRGSLQVDGMRIHGISIQSPITADKPGAPLAV